ncbi:MAG: DUF4317 domain-containing protein [Anaerovoracaceae bacterium]|nr:DUF4317 domain-containing protein [Anaerovoracaceae bacterium]
MNQNELKEIRRRFRPDQDNISRIYGCYVNAAKEIVTRIDMSLGLMEQEETQMYYKILKKALSGTLGRNLIDIEFSTAQVESSDEHRLLQALRTSHLSDESMRELMYERIIETLDFGDESYVILMASDSYDVPYRGGDGEVFDEGSSEVFDYFICCVCPVKDAKAALRYESEERAFRGASTGHVLGAPEIGFMFPSFDDRCANIYNLLYYSRNVSEIHDEFIKGIFNTESIPLSAVAQKEAFGDSLSFSLGDNCSLEVVQAVHEDIRDKLALHKESKEPELPEIYIEDVDDILRKSGVPDEKINFFNEECQKQLGGSDTFNPGNLIETKKFEMVTPEVKITVDPEYAYRIKTGIIDGEKYILIPADGDVAVNGIQVNIEE